MYNIAARNFSTSAGNNKVCNYNDIRDIHISRSHEPEL